MSDSFEVQEENVCLDFTATLININLGHNKEIMENCQKLREYAQFIAAIRFYQCKGYDLEKSIEFAIEDCIEQGVLAEILAKNRSEVTKMLLTTYDEKKHIKMERADAMEEGRIAGIEQGIEAFIIDNLEEGKSEEIVLKKLTKHFQMKSEMAKTYYDRYASEFIQ